MWTLKKNDSFLKRFLNFHLRVKVPSRYFLYDYEGLLCKYEKENHHSRDILHVKTNLKDVISFSKKSGDKHFKWDNGLYELYSANQTTVHIKKDQRMTGSIEYEERASIWNETNHVIDLTLDEADERALPVLILLYINEFYQDRIGGV